MVSAPSFLGGKNQMQMAYNPQTGLFYVPANEWGMDIWNEPGPPQARRRLPGRGLHHQGALHDDYIGAARGRSGRRQDRLKTRTTPAVGRRDDLTAGNLTFYGTPKAT